MEGQRVKDKKEAVPTSAYAGSTEIITTLEVLTTGEDAGELRTEAVGGIRNLG